MGDMAPPRWILRKAPTVVSGLVILPPGSSDRAQSAWHRYAGARWDVVIPGAPPAHWDEMPAIRLRRLAGLLTAIAFMHDYHWCLVLLSDLVPGRACPGDALITLWHHVVATANDHMPPPFLADQTSDGKMGQHFLLLQGIGSNTPLLPDPTPRTNDSGN